MSLVRPIPFPASDLARFTNWHHTRHTRNYRLVANFGVIGLRHDWWCGKIRSILFLYRLL